MPKKKTQTQTYSLISYDTWGNTRDGFEVNAAHFTGQQLDLTGEETDRTINYRLGVRGVEWEGDPEYALYGTLKRNGMPVLELRRS